MKLLCQKYYGLITRCEQCGAVIGYNANDIYNNYYLYCPQCKAQIKILIDLKYDGLVKENTK